MVTKIAARSAARPDPNRAIDDFHLDAGSIFDFACRETCYTIVDIEGHTSFGCGESMAKLGLRIKELEMVQDRLVCDLSRQANILRCNLMCGWAHQSAAPVRRCSGNMSDAMR